VLLPGFSGSDALQFAIAEPAALPPLAATPFTVTEAMPLLPNPASLAVPPSVIGLALTDWLLL
jgi:hypothetical protein